MLALRRGRLGERQLGGGEVPIPDGPGEQPTQGGRSTPPDDKPKYRDNCDDKDEVVKAG